jgi:hypothetical protein
VRVPETMNSRLAFHNFFDVLHSKYTKFEIILLEKRMTKKIIAKTIGHDIACLVMEHLPEKAISNGSVLLEMNKVVIILFFNRGNSTFEIKVPQFDVFLGYFGNNYTLLFDLLGTFTTDKCRCLKTFTFLAKKNGFNVLGYMENYNNLCICLKQVNGN